MRRKVHAVCPSDKRHVSAVIHDDPCPRPANTATDALHKGQQQCSGDLRLTYLNDVNLGGDRIINQALERRHFLVQRACVRRQTTAVGNQIDSRERDRSHG